MESLLLAVGILRLHKLSTAVMGYRGSPFGRDIGRFPVRKLHGAPAAFRSSGLGQFRVSSGFRRARTSKSSASWPQTTTASAGEGLGPGALSDSAGACSGQVPLASCTVRGRAQSCLPQARFMGSFRQGCILILGPRDSLLGFSALEHRITLSHTKRIQQHKNKHVTCYENVDYNRLL